VVQRFQLKPQRYVRREFLKRLEFVAKAKGVPMLVFARRLLEEGLQREELLMAKGYEQSTKYLEGVLTLIIGGENGEHQRRASSGLSDERSRTEIHGEQHAGVHLHDCDKSLQDAERPEGNGTGISPMHGV
jgi:hypothetical protein